MAQSSTYVVLARQRTGARRASPAAYGRDDFPGCESFHLTASEIDVLKARGIEPASALTEDREIFSARSGEVEMAAAPACTDRADFLRRIGQRRDVQTGLPSPADPEG